MFDSIVAIDIGSTSVKMVLAKRGLRDFHITDLATENLDLSFESKTDSVRDAVTRLSARHPFEGCLVVVNYPMEKTVVRHLVFPFTDENSISRIVPAEAQDAIPFPIEDLILDYQITNNQTDPEGRVLVAATHNDSVADYLSFLSGSGVTPSRLIFEPNALFECYSYFAHTADESVIQIDIGNSKSIINIIRDNKLEYTRCVTTGFQSAIDGIAHD